MYIKSSSEPKVSNRYLTDVDPSDANIRTNVINFNALIIARGYTLITSSHSNSCLINRTGRQGMYGRVTQDIDK